MTFLKKIIQLRRDGKIPKKWKINDIKPFLESEFKESTINIYPYNSSISVDGKITGDFVKRGQKPKFFRFPGGYFQIIDEVLEKTEHKLNNVEKHSIKRKVINTEKKNKKIFFRNREDFFRYIKICDDDYRKVSPSIVLYREMIKKHNEIELDDLLGENDFFELIYATLISWNMNQRGARLVDFDEFKSSLDSLKNELIEVSEYKIEDFRSNSQNNILPKIECIYEKMSVMKSRSNLVGNSKTLHFLLPRLIMPIDRTFTLNFFFGNTEVSHGHRAEFNIFKQVLQYFLDIINRLKLSEKDVNGLGWNTTLPKLIDNAIIGYMIEKKRIN